MKNSSIGCARRPFGSRRPTSYFGGRARMDGNYFWYERHIVHRKGYRRRVVGRCDSPRLHEHAAKAPCRGCAVSFTAARAYSPSQSPPGSAAYPERVRRRIANLDLELIVTEAIR